MLTKYDIGDAVLIRATVEQIHVSEDGISYLLRLPPSDEYMPEIILREKDIGGAVNAET